MVLTALLSSGCGTIKVDLISDGTQTAQAQQAQGSEAAASDTGSPLPAPQQTEAPTELPTEAPTAKPTEAPTAEPTPEPTPITASVGFAGDVLMMQSQIAAARKSGGGYDFTSQFRPMQGLFESVDFMLLNFEGTLAGKDAGYTGPKPEVGFQRFNAPDEIVGDLMALGVDGFSTANNHCLDKGVDGLLRTVEVMDACGVFHTGTFSSPERQKTADIIELNGIKVGFVSVTNSVNSYDGILSAEQAKYMVNRLGNSEMTEAAIRRCREQGAELVIVMMHVGEEYQNYQNSVQEAFALNLIKWGADAVIGCHAHVVQPIRWMSAMRGNENTVAPVVYSMGNFVSNMSSSVYPTNIGLFIRLDIEKDEYGARVAGISYAPVYNSIRWDAGYTNEVIPCFDDMTGVEAKFGISSYMSGINKAIAHCEDIIGESVERLTNPKTERYD